VNSGAADFPSALEEEEEEEEDDTRILDWGWSDEVGRSGVGDPKNIGRRMWLSKERE